ncbi:MAG TPA: CDP-alcohol phosphatidyltransferase family protein [Acidobacteriota bacterium]|nr:CDP-alcohol phosphatidyltransferase family protein [Acidobacteriota bacterium]
MNDQNAKAFRFLPRALNAVISRFFDRVSVFFVRRHIHPNTLTYMGIVAGVAVGIAYFFERPVWALVLILICGNLDILDGKVAANSNRKSLFGAILDSSFDRYSEFFMYLGIAYHFRGGWVVWVVFVAFLGSTMVSYTRARAEGLGIDCRVGIMQRAERLILLFVGTFIGLVFRVYDPALTVVMGLIALGANATAFQRLAYVRAWEKRKTGGRS